MTKQTLSYDHLERLKKQWVSTIDAIVDPLLVVNEKYEIIRSNKVFAENTNIDIKQVPGKLCYEVFASRDKPCEGCPLQDTIKERKSLTKELSTVKINKYYELTTQILSEEKDKATEVLIIYKDRTLANQLKKQLVHSEKLASIGTLAGGIAHELNNPLAGIIAFSQAVLMDVDKSDVVLYESIKEIENAAQRCSEIIQSLLVYARQNPDYHHKITNEKMDIIENIKNAIKFVEIGMKNNGVEIEFPHKENTLEIQSDKNKLLQVFINIIQNAVYASSSGKKVKIDLKSEDNNITITIIDEGTGMDSDTLSKIYDPFFSTKPEGEGTGLGLAITLGIVKELGGNIQVESKVNKGTKFILSLAKEKA